MTNKFIALPHAENMSAFQKVWSQHICTVNVIVISIINAFIVTH